MIHPSLKRFYHSWNKSYNLRTITRKQHTTNTKSNKLLCTVFLLFLKLEEFSPFEWMNDIVVWSLIYIKWKIIIHQNNYLVIPDWWSILRFTNLPDADSFYSYLANPTTWTSSILCSGSGPCSCEDIIKNIMKHRVVSHKNKIKNLCRLYFSKPHLLNHNDTL